MDPRRLPRTVIDPKVRQVGFFAPRDRSLSGPTDAVSSSSPPIVTHLSPTGGNTLSPVMIPPPRHSSAPLSPLLRDSSTLPLSYTPSDLFPATSPTSTAVTISTAVDNGSGAPGKGTAAAVAVSVASGSLPAGGFQMLPSVANLPTEKMDEVENGQSTHSKPLKVKTTKAERRALQEAQRAAKAAAKADGATAANTKPSKTTRTLPIQKNDSVPSAISDKKGGERPVEKERKKDVPQPHMQYDNKSRVEKAKRRSAIKLTEVRNRVELFRHLPQYEHGTLLTVLELKFFQLDPMHPTVYKVGLQYLTGDVCGGNARCIAMLQAFQVVIRDYSTPPEKTLTRDLTVKIGSYVSFLIECRPLSISMGNAIRFLKNRIANLPITLFESEAKATLRADIDHFINEKIILADKVIVKHAVTKIGDGDVLLTYGSSSAVEMIFLHAHELGKQLCCDS